MNGPWRKWSGRLLRSQYWVTPKLRVIGGRAHISSRPQMPIDRRSGRAHQLLRMLAGGELGTARVPGGQTTSAAASPGRPTEVAARTTSPSVHTPTHRT